MHPDDLLRVHVLRPIVRLLHLRAAVRIVERKKKKGSSRAKAGFPSLFSSFFPNS